MTNSTTQALPTGEGAVVRYRGHHGFPWIAWLGRGDLYGPTWYVNRADSVSPGAPRPVSPEDLAKEVGSELVIVSRGEGVLGGPDFPFPEVTRFEVIDESGRAYMAYRAREVSAHLQDEGRTLKVFLRAEL